MLQKIVVGTLVAALSGVLIVGAINRTEAKSEQGAQEQGANPGRLAREETQELLQLNQGQQGQGYRAAYAETDTLESVLRGGGQGRFSEDPSGNWLEDTSRSGEGSASADEWLEVVGTVVSMNEEELVLQLQDGQEMVIECKSWTYALELGFTTDIGNELKLYGFYEGEEFEVGGFEDLTMQLLTMVREERSSFLGRGFW